MQRDPDQTACSDCTTDVASFPKGCATVASAGASFGLPLAGIIDIAEEKALAKVYRKLAKELGGLRDGEQSEICRKCP